MGNYFTFEKVSNIPVNTTSSIISKFKKWWPLKSNKPLNLNDDENPYIELKLTKTSLVTIV